MKAQTISQILNLASKREYTPSQAHKALVSAGVSVPMPAFLAQWDASKNKVDVVNFKTLEHRLAGFMAGMAHVQASKKAA